MKRDFILYIYLICILFSAPLYAENNYADNESNMQLNIEKAINAYKEKKGYYPVMLRQLVKNKYITQLEEKKFISNYRQTHRYNPLTGEISPYISKETAPSASETVAPKLNPIAIKHFEQYEKLLNSPELQNKRKEIHHLFSYNPSQILPQFIAYLSSKSYLELVAFKPYQFLNSVEIDSESILGGLIYYLDHYDISSINPRVLGCLFHYIRVHGGDKPWSSTYETVLTRYYKKEKHFPEELVNILYARDYHFTGQILAAALCSATRNSADAPEANKLNREIHKLENYYWCFWYGYELDSHALTEREKILGKLIKSKYWWVRLYCVYYIPRLSLDQKDSYKNMVNILRTDSNPYIKSYYQQIDKTKQKEKEHFLKIIEKRKQKLKEKAAKKK